MEYFIVKLQHEQLLVWIPSRNGFYQQMPSPYFSIELAKTVYKRICLPNGKYNPKFVQIVTREQFEQIRPQFPKWTKTNRNPNVIRGANYSDKGEIRGANYNDGGHTNVGNVGWMKYRKSVYPSKPKSNEI